MVLHFQKTYFVKSAAKLSQLPADQGQEIAFVGRSNSGKSTALNRLVQQKTLARTSKTPGRTQLINVFEVQPGYRLIDLPGYGFAKVSASQQRYWGELVGNYLNERRSLQGLVMLMDCRHPMMENDCQLLEWNDQAQIPCHIVLTKADKLKYGARQKALQHVQTICEPEPHLSVQLFSALKNQGIDELQHKMADWLSQEDDSTKQI